MDVPIAPADHDAVTQALPTAAVGDRCTNCQSPLASDQRYCVACGARRGKPRFSYAAMTAQAAPPPIAPKQRRPRVSAAFTLVAGVATLLLAMGIGVLIGHNNGNDSSRQAAAPAQIITVNGGGGAAAATPTSTTASTGKPGKAGKTQTPKLTKKVVKKVTAAATKVLGGSTALAAPTAKQGSSCSHGAGCQGGKFTGNFFGH